MHGPGMCWVQSRNRIKKKGKIDARARFQTQGELIIAYHWSNHEVLAVLTDLNDYWNSSGNMITKYAHANQLLINMHSNCFKHVLMQNLAILKGNLTNLMKITHSQREKIKHNQHKN